MRYALGLIGIAAVAAACARKAPPAGPRALEVATPCGHAMWQAGELRPANVEVVNRSGDSVAVWLDRCGGHTRVADLAAGDSVVVALPNGAASFNGKLRFISYYDQGKAIAVQLVPPEANPHIRLVLNQAAVSECPHVYVNGERYTKPLSTLPGERIESVEYLPTLPDELCPRISVRLKR